MKNVRINIPSFINWGVKEEDAYNYSAIGCVETAVPGKWGYRCTGMSYINFPRVLLCAMNNGVDLTSKKRFTKGYGYFTEMETYEDLLAAWDKTVREMTRYSVIVENAIDKASEKDVPDVFVLPLLMTVLVAAKQSKKVVPFMFSFPDFRLESQIWQILSLPSKSLFTKRKKSQNSSSGMQSLITSSHLKIKRFRKCL